MMLSYRQGANVAKLALQSSVHSPRAPKVTPTLPKTCKNGANMTQDDPREPQNGFEMAPRWSQEATSCGEEAKVVTLKLVKAEPR